MLFNTNSSYVHVGLGNPYGPAGTGKTESVKALALAFGELRCRLNTQADAAISAPTEG